ncbi:MAG: glycosyltransferase family 4 protein [Candidatus Lokiarchaeota archaeon]|nr:glycosyltransferase family 4 protein [Candidatus Lokiarchaeota archaeon]
MNILFIENFKLYKQLTSLKTIGGIETNTNDVIHDLRQKGHKIWVLNKEVKPIWAQKGEVDIIAASTFDPITLFQISKFKKKYKRRAAVVIHGHTTVEDLAGNFVPDKPIFDKVFKFWLKLLYSQAHLLITPSEFSKECIIKIQTSMTYPIYVVSNGIRIEDFKENKKYRVNFRRFLSQKYDIPEDAVVIINVGLSWKKKGVKVFGEIASKFPEYYFVWVGPISKNPEIDEITKIDNVIFTGFYNDIREAYYGADLLLNTSWVENQGIPLIEAAICKLPVVARDLSAFDWIVHEYSCYKAKNLAEFIEGINKIVSNSNFKKNIVENAYKDAVKLHDFEKIGEKIEKLYIKAIKVKKIWDHKRNK